MAFVLPITIADEADAICGDGVVDPSLCPCDCNLDFIVTVDEIITAVNIALGNLPVTACPAADPDLSGITTVDEIITCLNAALNGCPAFGGTEDCDDGGLCVGGSNAGMACDDESDCVGDGACFGGVSDLRGCVGDEDCAGAPCRKCRPYGGDGCAANCTIEAEDECALMACAGGPCTGPLDEGSVAVVSPAVLAPIPLPLVGTQVLTIGKLIGGSAPVVIKTTGVDVERIAISTIACACVRGAEARTCGGTLFDRNGVQSVNCTPGFADAEACPENLPCTAVHGPGNTGSGFIGCGDPGVNIEVIQDCNGTPGTEPFDPAVVVSENAETPPMSQGSAFLVFTSAIGTIVGVCNGTDPGYGPDQSFCTADDPIANRGAPNSIAFTTNFASATVLNPADFEGDVLGPVETEGAPLTCVDGRVAISGANLAGAFTACDQPTISDIAVTVNFVCE